MRDGGVGELVLCTFSKKENSKLYSKLYNWEESQRKYHIRNNKNSESSIKNDLIQTIVKAEEKNIGNYRIGCISIRL